MTLMQWEFAGLYIAELLLYSQPLWRYRKPIAALLVLAIGFTSGVYFFAEPNVLRALVLLISAYRIINLLRIVEAKMHANYLRRVTLKSSVWFSALQLGALGAASLEPHVSAATWLLVNAIIAAAGSAGIMATTIYHLRGLAAPSISHTVADRDLPSISVCIPARNETLNLEDCLRSVVASNYPKLEILVLDDASHDRTPDIIKSFAHDGVRFIRGDAAPGTWLAKNWAYQRLYQEANGQYIVFCGVDARFTPEAFTDMLQIALQTKQQVISFVPKNLLQSGWPHQLSVLLQPMRYAWELCLPRASFGRPPVLSTCWLVQREFIKQYGGLAAVARMVTPESYFARQASQQRTYSFLSSADSAAITTRKPMLEQWDTAVRTRYPQLHKRPEFVLLVSLVQIVILVMPLIALLCALFTAHWLVATTAGIAVLLVSINYALITKLTYRQFLWRGLVVGPMAVLIDIVARNYSLWRYEFKEVVWKGRDASGAVMHVEPHLPELE